MNVLFRLPSFSFLLVYILAILLGRYSNFAFPSFLILGFLFLLLSWFLYIKRFKLAFNIIILLSLFSLFLSYAEYRMDYKSEDNLSYYADKINVFYGKVISYPKIKTLDNKFVDCKSIPRRESIKRQEYMVEARAARFDSDLIEDISGIILVKSRYISNDIKPGQLIIVDASTYTVRGIKPCVDFDYRQFLIDRGIYYISYPFSREDIHLRDAAIELNLLEIWAGEVHNYLLSAYDKALPSMYSSLVKAIILGQREAVPFDIVSSFKRSGIMHILAISGLHIGMIAFFLYLFLMLFSLPKRYIYIIVGIILIFYLLIVGYRASILRSVIMFWCFGLVFILDRDRHYYNSVFLAGLLSLLIDPLFLFSIGFQLSFLATFGILIYFSRIEGFILALIGYNSLDLNGKIQPFLRILVKYFASLFSLTLSAQVLIIPVIIYYFKAFSLVSIFTNLFVILLVQCLVVLSLFLPFVILVPVFAEAYISVVSFVIDGIINVSDYFADFNFSYITIDHFRGEEYIFIILYYLVIFIILNPIVNKLLKGKYLRQEE